MTRDRAAAMAAIDRTLDAVSVQTHELAREHAPFASPHEVYGVIFEELCEFFDEARKKPHLRCNLSMRRELVDIACAAIRAASELETRRRVGPEMDGGKG